MTNYIDKLIEEKNIPEIRDEEDRIIEIIEAYEDDIFKLETIKLYEDDILKSLNGFYIQNQIERYRQIIEEETQILNYIREKKEELLNLLRESKDEGEK